MNIIFRKAIRADIPDIVRLLMDDNLGSSREQYNKNVPSSYYSAFDAINLDKNNYLVVAELDGKIIGTMQLTFITYMTYQGGKRLQIEGVRIDKTIRGRGIGQEMFKWAINKAKEEGCHVIQLTTDKKRPEALKFYKKLGFVDSHEGFKFHL
jgi:GNAT superfamily N-acetyltransferase